MCVHNVFLNKFAELCVYLSFHLSCFCMWRCEKKHVGKHLSLILFTFILFTKIIYYHVVITFITNPLLSSNKFLLILNAFKFKEGGVFFWKNKQSIPKNLGHATPLAIWLGVYLIPKPNTQIFSSCQCLVSPSISTTFTIITHFTRFVLSDFDLFDDQFSSDQSLGVAITSSPSTNSTRTTTRSSSTSR